VKSINCTGFSGKKIIHVNSASELKFTHTGFSKEKEKKLFTLMNSTTVEHSSTVQWFLPHEKQQNAASTKPAAQLNFWWVLPA